ncbi:CHAT domain-containing protein [Aquimarina litoralis]|uniref:CHAT domain-containing protein n=1 Tax=Aquimarina litoralis TaxID=584605 RepID=UPI001C5A499A|nr:CHAT domain-containing tetratricopeptide repeat protein [Aquimarina litoralis]MBW1295856.1 tetratricopeptide repeat protein [Aquimarina litoralis]
MKPLKTLVIFVLFTHFAFSQNTVKQDTLQAFQYFKKADSLLVDRKLDSSIVYFEKALPIYEKSKAWERVVGCYNGISKSYFEYSKYDASLKSAEIALSISNNYLDVSNLERARACNNLGQYYLKKTNWKKAKDYFRIAKGVFTSKNKTSGIIESYNNLGQVYLAENDFTSAEEEFKKAINVDKSEDNSFLAFSYNNLARIYYIKAKYEVSIEFMSKAIFLEKRRLGEDHPQIARYYNNIGTIYERLGKDEEALAYYKKALAIQLQVSGNSHSSIASFYNNISKILYKKGDLDGSIEYLEKAIEIAKQVYGEDNLKLVNYYSNISYKYGDKGKFQKALFYTKKALEISFKFNEVDSYYVASTYNNMASIHMALGQYEKALHYSIKSNEIREKLFGKIHPDVATSYLNLGQISFLKEDMKQALSYFKKSERIKVKTLGKDHLDLGKNYFDIGELYLKNKQYDSALYYQNKALKVYKNNVYEKDYRVLRTYCQIGNSYRKKKQLKQAMSYYDMVLDFDKKKSLNKLIENSDFNTLKALLYAYTGKGGVYRDLYFKENDINYLKNSIDNYKNADTLAITTRHFLFGYKEKLLVSEAVKKMYGGAIQSTLQLFVINNDPNLLQNAYEYSEKSRSSVLKDLLQDSNAKSFSGLSPDLIELEKSVKIDKAYYESKVNEQLSNVKIDSTKLFTHQSKLFDISRRQDSLTEVLEKNYPKYHQLKYDNEVISVTEVQQKLDDQTTLLEFFTADSTTYAFTISKSNIAVKELSTSKLEEQIKEFQSAITKDYEAYKEISYELYETLIAPIRKELVGSQLIIVPDGPLWHLNFDLLLTGESASNNPTNWPYLLKDYAISYANSATLLFRDKLEQEPDSKTLQECLAFSFSGEDNATTTTNVRLRSLRGSGTDLPGTREEIGAIANIVDGQYFYGSEATEQNFKQHAGAYNILHLALHGDVDNERPENSKLYFTKSKDTVEDNYLYSHELFALDIPAELTVLSACNTGTGKIAKGEGIMSLGNAFQYAGTKSLLLTNWEVSDETTPKIMEYFYRNLKDGKNKAEALQQAKLQFLTTTNQETNHPYYWGGFYLLGDTAVIELQNDTSKYWWIGFGVLALILVSLFWYRKKNALTTSQAQ